MDQAKTKILQKRVDEQEVTLKDFNVVLRKLVDFNKNVVEQEKKIQGLMACNKLVVDVENGQRKSIENLRQRIDALEEQITELKRVVLLEKKADELKKPVEAPMDGPPSHPPVDQVDVGRSYH